MSNLSEASIFRQLYKYELTALHIITEYTSTLHNISLCLLRSVNTLNPTLKFKTILNKSQLLLKAPYLEVTLTFLRFAAKHCSIAHYSLAILMSEKRHKINKIANYQNIKVENSPAFDHHAFVSSQDRWFMVFDVMRMISTQIRWQEPCWSLCKLWEHRLDFI